MVEHFNIAPWLLRSKVMPPRQLTSVIERETLLERLDDAMLGALIVLEAPGGYGKSSLLSQWRARRHAAGETVCWLSVDEDDDAQTLLAYLAFAAHVSGIDAASTDLMSFEFTIDKDIVQTIYQFLAMLERHDAPVRIVIDDFERLDSAVVNAAMPLLLRRLPANVTIVIASREPVGLNTVDLDHRGLVGRFGPHDLQFVHSEIADLWGARLTKRQMARLETQTEGWPVLICMLLTAYDMGTFDIRHIDDVSYSDQSIMTYFEQKILMRLDPKTREFLHRCSVFDEIDFDLVEQVLEWPDPKEALSQLTGLEAFASPLPGPEAGYRLHPMMREYLRHRLQDSDPDLYEGLYRRLARFFSDRGNHVRAVRSALKCRDRQVVLETIEATRAVVLWFQEGLVEFRAIDQCLDDETVLASPTAGLMRVLILIKRGRQFEAGELYQSVTEAHADRIAADTTLSASAFACRIMLSIYRGRYVDPADIDGFQRHIRTLSEESGAFVGFILTIKCVACHQQGRLDESIDYGQQAITILREIGSLYGEFFIHLHLSMIAGLTGHLEEMHTEFKRVSSIVRTTLGYDDGARILYEVLKKESEHEAAPLDQKGVERLNNIAIKLLKKEGWLDIYAAAARTLSEKLYLTGAYSEALMAVETFAEFAERNDMVYLGDVCAAQRALLLAWMGDDDGARAALSQARFYAENKEQYLSIAPWRAGEALGEAELSVAALDADDDQLMRWSRYRDIHRGFGNTRVATRLSVLLAIKDGRQIKEGTRILAEGLGRRFDRAIVFSDAALREVCTSDESKPHGELILSRLNSLRAQRRRMADVDQGARLFSEKEITVLRELSAGQSDKEIALVIGMTEHGVRYHLKKIYQKLSVKSRTEAVDKARHLGGVLR
ncbi:MAG: LuxR C-terminal-related transcriptional regulator [Pseudomonadota bacterium]